MTSRKRIRRNTNTTPALRRVCILLFLSILLQPKVSVHGFSQSSIRFHNLATPRSNHHFVPLIRSKYSKQKASVADEEQDLNVSIETEEPSKKRPIPLYKLPKAAYKIYTTYAKHLWKETDVSARKRIAKDKVKGAIRNMQNILVHANEYAEFDGVTFEAKKKLMASCDDMLNTLQDTTETRIDTEDKAATALESTKSEISSSEETTTTPAAPKKKKSRSILFGALMGLACACWVFSGNYIFTGLFTLMTILGQLEYYRMVMKTGVYAARRISVIGASSMFLTALFAPNLHQICLPMFGLWAMIWFLTMRREYSSIPEIATTFTGMFYLGYVPSFWVRIRTLGADMEPTKIHAIMGPVREVLKERFAIIFPDRLVRSPITNGAVFIFWSWLSLAFSDVGAYFVGRKYGKTKLGQVAPAAGATSPNKTVEGVIGGCVFSAFFSIIGAWVQKWPYFVLTGALHGIILGFLGLIGDLTASMMKRDAGAKDFGDLIPEHGGILDRVDSFVWTAPYSWLVCAYIIPALKATVAP